MKISNAFPSNYLKAADLNGGSPTVAISHVAMEDIGGDHKPVVFFIGKEKGVVLNKTNANMIASLYGDDTDDWSGKEVTLIATWVDFQGKQVEAIRVRPPKKPALKAVAQGGSHEPPQSHPVNDDIPF